jgi:hypothetical protein
VISAVLVALVALVLGLLSFIVADRIGRNSEAVTLLADCTTAGPKPPPDTGHACYDESQKRTAAFRDEFRRSIDCVALYAIGKRPPACAAVDARMDEIQAGGDPFATPTTGARP